MISPLQKLLVASLLCVVLALAAGMALVARSQVQKAELREIAESTARTASTPSGTTRTAANAGIITVGYTASR